MTVKTEYIKVSTKGNAQVLDITPQVLEIMADAGVKDGIVTVSCVGSTGAVTTCEFEPGLIEDIPEILDKLIPAGSYHHDRTWGDGNGHSHLRASLIGPSVTLPLSQGELVTGTWQQIVFIDFDNRGRQRKIAVQVMGE